MQLVGSAGFKFCPNQLATFASYEKCCMIFAIPNKVRICLSLGCRKNVFRQLLPPAIP